MYEAPLAQKSLSNQPAFPISVANSRDQLEHELNLHGELFHPHVIKQIPIGMTLEWKFRRATVNMTTP